MKNQVKSALAISILAMSAAAASAQDRPRVNLNQSQANNSTHTPGITYNYAGVRYIYQDIDASWGSCDQDGLNIYGSMDIQDGFFARASFSDVSGTNGCGSRSFIAGGGYHTPFSDTTDMYATISFGSVSPDSGESDSGIELAAGMRRYLKERLEGSVELFHSTISDDSQTGIRGGVSHWFDDRFSLTADVGLSADNTTLGLGLRMAF